MATPDCRDVGRTLSLPAPANLQVSQSRSQCCWTKWKGRVLGSKDICENDKNEENQPYDNCLPMKNKSKGWGAPLGPHPRVPILIH